MWQEAAALHPNPLAALHAHRKVMAVIGIYYCPSIPDVARAYSAFELQCKCATGVIPARPCHGGLAKTGRIGLWLEPAWCPTCNMLNIYERRSLTEKSPRRAFPDAVTFRCFAFEPSESQMQHAAMPNLMPFPPGAPCQATAYNAALPRPIFQVPIMQSSTIVCCTQTLRHLAPC